MKHSQMNSQPSKSSQDPVNLRQKQESLLSSVFKFTEKEETVHWKSYTNALFVFHFSVSSCKKISPPNWILFLHYLEKQNPHPLAYTSLLCNRHHHLTVVPCWTQTLASAYIALCKRTKGLCVCNPSIAFSAHGAEKCNLMLIYSDKKIQT